ncbi:unnamed protein product [Calypogeia fissa]
MIEPDFCKQPPPYNSIMD